MNKRDDLKGTYKYNNALFRYRQRLKFLYPFALLKWLVISLMTSLIGVINDGYPFLIVFLSCFISLFIYETIKLIYRYRRKYDVYTIFVTDKKEEHYGQSPTCYFIFENAQKFKLIDKVLYRNIMRGQLYTFLACKSYIVDIVE